MGKKIHTNILKLPVYGITIAMKGDEGEIYSELREVCPNCHSTDCTLEAATYNAAIDGLEGLILAMALAGVDLTTPAMLQAIEDGVELIDEWY